MENTEQVQQLHKLAKQSIVNVSERYGVLKAQCILTDFGLTKLVDASNDRVKLAAVLFMSEATAEQLGKPEDYIGGKLPEEVEFSNKVETAGLMMIKALNSRGVYLPNPTTRRLAARVAEKKQAASLIDLAHTGPEETTRLMIQVEELTKRLRLQSNELDKAKAEIVNLKDELEQQEIEALPVNPKILAQRMSPGPLTAGELNAKVGYESLRQILQDALNQAMNGKGHERHSNGLSFEEQPMQAICDILGSPEGMVYQVMKKLKEALGLPDADHQYHEVLGAVNYAAGVALWMQRHRQEEPDNL